MAEQWKVTRTTKPVIKWRVLCPKCSHKEREAKIAEKVGRNDAN